MNSASRAVRNASGIAGGLLEAELFRDRDRHPLVDRDLLGVAAAGEQRHHAVARFDRGNTGSELGDHAGALEAQDLAFALGRRVHAAALEQIGAVQRRGFDLDQDLVFAERRVGDFARARFSGPPGSVMTIAFMRDRYSRSRATDQQAIAPSRAWSYGNPGSAAVPSSLALPLVLQADASGVAVAADRIGRRGKGCRFPDGPAGTPRRRRTAGCSASPAGTQTQTSLP